MNTVQHPVASLSSVLARPAQADAEPDFEGTTEEVEEGALELWETVLEALPRLGIALTFVAVGWLASRLVRAGLRWRWERRQTKSFAQVMSKLAGWTVLATAVFVAIALTFPSVKPVDLLAGLGFFSVAAGFAFQDILENTLSGVLLLFRQPFRAGDPIEVEGVHGIVDGITIRETRLTTLDGEVVLIPNRDVYKSVLRLPNASGLRRTSFVVGVAYGTDVGRARTIIADAVRAADGVSDQRDPEILVQAPGASTIDLEVRVWTDPRDHDITVVAGHAVDRAVTALEEAGVSMPSPIMELDATGALASALSEVATERR